MDIEIDLIFPAHGTFIWLILNRSLLAPGFYWNDLVWEQMDESAWDIWLAQSQVPVYVYYRRKIISYIQMCGVWLYWKVINKILSGLIRIELMWKPCIPNLNIAINVYLKRLSIAISTSSVWNKWSARLFSISLLHCLCNVRFNKEMIFRWNESSNPLIFSIWIIRFPIENWKSL